MKKQIPKTEENKSVHIHDCKFVGNEWNGRIVTLLEETVRGLVNVTEILKRTTDSSNLPAALHLTNSNSKLPVVVEDIKIYGASVGVIADEKK